MPLTTTGFGGVALSCSVIHHGKIVEHKAIRDDLSLMVQLEVVGPKSDQYEPLFHTWKAWKGL